MTCVPALRLLVVKLAWPLPSTAVGPPSVLPGLEHVPPSMKITLPSVTTVLPQAVATVAVNVTALPNFDVGGATSRIMVLPTGQRLLFPSQVSETSQPAEGSRHTVPAGLLASAGHAVLVPVQVSAASQAPDDDRHIAPALPAGCWQLLLVP